MATFNLPADVRRVLRLDSGNNYLTDAEIQSYLDEAQNWLYTEIKRKYERDFFTVVTNSVGNTQVIYALSLAPINSVLKVLVNDVEKTVTTDYTVDTDLGEIIFVEGVVTVGDKVKVYSVPTAYELAELYIAARNISIGTNLINLDGQNNPVVQNFDTLINNYMNVITSRVMVATWA